MARRTDFEVFLTSVATMLTTEMRASKRLHDPTAFETRVRELLKLQSRSTDFAYDETKRAYNFPDNVLDEFGVEVKFANKDSWRSVANSIFEGTRSERVKYIYIMFGKSGGTPEVRWGRYDDCVIHVRTSHVPRFEVQIDATESLFSKLGTTYEHFSGLSTHEKMEYVRRYARGRLKKGERLWWLEDSGQEPHSLPLEVRLYTSLDTAEKRKLRAEAAILCPQVVKPSRVHGKYDDATLYLLTYYGVLCNQARDLFSAGSVALHADSTRGGDYVQRALHDIQDEMVEAAGRLENALFEEYWGRTPGRNRLKDWLAMADGYAKQWTPSMVLSKLSARATAKKL